MYTAVEIENEVDSVTRFGRTWQTHRDGSSSSEMTRYRYVGDGNKPAYTAADAFMMPQS